MIKTGKTVISGNKGIRSMPKYISHNSFVSRKNCLIIFYNFPFYFVTDYLSENTTLLTIIILVTLPNHKYGNPVIF